MGERQFGPYRLVQQIAVGGMAEIHLAKTHGIAGFEKYIALKMIHPNFSSDSQFIEMLVDEAKISVQLQHANIAQTFDLGRVGDTYYITMEYVDGADLYRLLRRAAERQMPMPVDVAAFIAKEMANGLDYAHSRRDNAGNPLGIVHRDVSPQNVLISHVGEVKMVDFGIAKATMKARQTAVGVIKGKYYYMSPEQAWGDIVDHRTDIFATGICLYEALTGRMLYQQEDLRQLLDAVRRAEIPPPTVRRHDIPPQLERIIMHALPKRPEDRYQSAADMALDLERFLHVYSPVFTAAKVAEYFHSVLGYTSLAAKAARAAAAASQAAAEEGVDQTMRLEPDQILSDSDDFNDENSIIFDTRSSGRLASQPPPIHTVSTSAHTLSGLESPDTSDFGPQQTLVTGSINVGARSSPQAATAPAIHSRAVPGSGQHPAYAPPPGASSVSLDDNGDNSDEQTLLSDGPPAILREMQQQMAAHNAAHAAGAAGAAGADDRRQGWAPAHDHLDQADQAEVTLVSSGESPHFAVSGAIPNVTQELKDYDLDNAQTLKRSPKEARRMAEEVFGPGGIPNRGSGSPGTARATTSAPPPLQTNPDSRTIVPGRPQQHPQTAPRAGTGPASATRRATSASGPRSAPNAVLSAQNPQPAVSLTAQHAEPRKTPTGLPSTGAMPAENQAPAGPSLISALMNRDDVGPSVRRDPIAEHPANVNPAAPAPHPHAQAGAQQVGAQQVGAQQVGAQQVGYDVAGSQHPHGGPGLPPMSPATAGMPGHFPPGQQQQVPSPQALAAAQQHPGQGNYLNSGGPGHGIMQQTFTQQMRAAVDTEAMPDSHKLEHGGSRWIWAMILIVVCVGTGVGLGMVIINQQDEAPAALLIESMPDGAAVTINGKRLAEQTPVLYQGVKPGVRYTIDFAMDGFQPESKTVIYSATDGEKRVFANLARRRVDVIINSDPPGAQIFINNKMHGRTPRTISGLDPSKSYQLDLHLKGYQSHQEQLQFDDQSELRRDIALKK